MNRGAWQSTVHRVTWSQIRLKRLNMHAHTSYEMMGWTNPKMELRLLGEISTNSYMEMMSEMAENKEELKSLLIRVKEDNEKSGLKLNIQKTRIMATDPITGK